jgi:hypothetical protein
MRGDNIIFDLDDQLPSAVQACVWEAMMDFAAHPDQASRVLRELELCAMEQQGGVHRSYLPLSLR